MDAYSVRDPDYIRRVRANFDQQAMMVTLGAKLSLVEPGVVEITAPYDPKFSQQDGFLHAGAVTSLVDSACGYAAFTLMPPDARILSVEFKVNLLAPAKGDRFVARGNVIKPGRTLTICNGELHAFDGGDRKRVALMQATMICLRNGS